MILSQLLELWTQKYCQTFVLHPVKNGKHLTGNGFILQHDNNLKHTANAVKANLKEKHIMKQYQSWIGSEQANPWLIASTLLMHCGIILSWRGELWIFKSSKDGLPNIDFYICWNSCILVYYTSIYSFFMFYKTIKKNIKKRKVTRDPSTALYMQCISS